MVATDSLPSPINLRNTYDTARRDSCGYNCRALAISLTEALLAEGIPARYITCLPKAWNTDNDCHVICVAWSESLGKWIWVDPTFAAYVTDENGLLLDPGEVRYRLRKDLPVVLNKDANWNNKDLVTHEEYIDYYMAKNLYILQCNSFNQAEPEGESCHKQGYHVTLVPKGVSYPHSSTISLPMNSGSGKLLQGRNDNSNGRGDKDSLHGIFLLASNRRCAFCVSETFEYICILIYTMHIYEI